MELRQVMKAEAKACSGVLNAVSCHCRLYNAKESGLLEYSTSKIYALMFAREINKRLKVLKAPLPLLALSLAVYLSTLHVRINAPSSSTRLSTMLLSTDTSGTKVSQSFCLVHRVRTLEWNSMLHSQGLCRPHCTARGTSASSP